LLLIFCTWPSATPGKLVFGVAAVVPRKLLPLKGHNNILNDQTDTYLDEFNADFGKYLETLDYDYEASENKDRFKEDKVKFINENIDRVRWSSRLDQNLFAQFLEFYEKVIQ